MQHKRLLDYLDNEDALVNYNIDTGSTEIHSYGSEITFDTTQTLCSTKVDSDGKLNVYHEYDALLPVHLASYWIVHDEIPNMLKQDILNTAESIIQQAEIAKIGGIATATGATVAALILVFGVGSIISSILGGGNGGDDSPVVDVFAINLSINENKNNINNLSVESTLAITTLSNTTTSILGYINNLTRYSTLNTNNLNVSGFATLNNTTCMSSLNVSGFATLNNNNTMLPSLNVSGHTTLNNVILKNNTTFMSSLNVSGFATLNNATSISSTLNVSGFTTLYYYYFIIECIRIDNIK
jgi:hypothetical protein